MKAIVYGAAAALFVCAPASAAPAKAPSKASVAKAPAKAAPVKVAAKAPLPVFEFKGIKAGEAVPAEAVKCDLAAPAEEKECPFVQASIAGVNPIYPESGRFSQATLYNGKLSGIEFIADNGGAGFLTILQAFTERYGKPCRTEEPKWQNKAGSTFDNSVVTWCFKTGDLVLKQMDFQRDYLSVRYSDRENTKPAAKPKIDF